MSDEARQRDGAAAAGEPREPGSRGSQPPSALPPGAQPPEPDELDLLADSVDAFEAAWRRGEAPTIEDWVARAGALGPRLRPLLASLTLVARAASSLGSATLTVAAPTPAMIGPFRILRELGRGGMGTVYLAEQRGLGRTVALKVLSAGLSADPQLVERFRREASAAARLAHPHIVTVHEFGEADGVLYYVMQYVEGVSLEQVFARVARREASAVRRSREPSGVTALIRKLRAGDEESPDDATTSLGPREAARLVLQVAQALAFAHAGGVLHRDVKPGNILLDAHGRALLADFGLCRLADEAQLTTPGDVVGTLRYMAPEQIDGEPGTRSDVYSLGMVLYELVTRRPAFNAKRRAALVRDVLYAEPARPRSIDPKLPADLETITLKATAKVEAQRYGSAADMARDLEAFLAGEPISARPMSLGYRLRLFSARHRAVLAVVAASLFALAWLGVRYVRDGHAAGARLEREAYAAQLAASEAALLSGAVTRARAHLSAAPEALRSWEWQHLLLRCDQSLGRVQPFGGDAAIRALDYHPEKRLVLAGSGRGAALIDEVTSQVVARGTVPDVTAVAWSRDGASAFVAGYRAGLHLVAATDLASSGKALRVSGAIDLLRSLADGRIAYATEPGEVGTWDPLTGAHEVLCETHVRALWLGVDADERHLWVLTADGVLRRLGDAPRELELPRHGDVFLHAADVDLAARRAALSCASGSILVVDIDTGHILSAASMGSTSFSVELDTQHDLLLAGCQDHLVRIWPASGVGPPMTLTAHDDDVARVALAPDGRRFVTGDYMGQVHFWSAGHYGAAITLRGHVNDVWCVAPSPRDETLASGARDGLILGFDLAHGGPPRVIARGLAGVGGLAFDREGERLFVATIGGEVLLLDAASGARVAAALRGEARELALDEAQQRLYVATTSGVDVYDAALTLQAETYPIPGAGALRVALDPRGCWVAVGDAAGALHLLERPSGRTLARLQLFDAAVADLVVDARTGLLAAVAASSRIELVDVERRARAGALESASAGDVGEVVLNVTFSADGSRLFAACRSGRVMVWDMVARRRLVDLSAHAKYANFVTVDPRQGRLFTGGADTTVRVFDLVSASARLALNPGAGDTEAPFSDPRMGHCAQTHFALCALIEGGEERLGWTGTLIIGLKRFAPFDPDHAVLASLLWNLAGDPAAARREGALAAQNLARARRIGGDTHVHPVSRLFADRAAWMTFGRASLQLASRLPLPRARCD
ncbi:MAG: WD40 repeat domain-containing serine/threonine-protein kinase [Planctomycetota bacterium]